MPIHEQIGRFQFDPICKFRGKQEIVIPRCRIDPNDYAGLSKLFQDSDEEACFPDIYNVGMIPMSRYLQECNCCFWMSIGEAVNFLVHLGQASILKNCEEHLTLANIFWAHTSPSLATVSWTGCCGGQVTFTSLLIEWLKSTCPSTIPNLTSSLHNRLTATTSPAQAAGKVYGVPWLQWH